MTRISLAGADERRSERVLVVKVYLSLGALRKVPLNAPGLATRRGGIDE